MKAVTVSRKSWHYRLHSFVFTFFNWESYGPLPALRGRRWNHQPNSICGYTWSTIFLTLFLPIFLLLVAAVALVAAIPVALFFAIRYANRKYRTVRPKPKDAPPGRIARNTEIFVHYAAARKAKACPLIELTD